MAVALLSRNSRKKHFGSIGKWKRPHFTYPELRERVKPPLPFKLHGNCFKPVGRFNKLTDQMNQPEDREYYF